MKKLYEIYKLHPDDTRYGHKLKLQLKQNFVLLAKQQVSTRFDCQWFHWITSSAIHTQETHPVRTAIDQRGEQTLNKDAKPSGI